MLNFPLLYKHTLDFLLHLLRAFVEAILRRFLIPIPEDISNISPFDLNIGFISLT